MKLYHSSPASSRESIEHLGLVPSYDRWGRDRTYFWYRLSDAENYHSEYDVWEVELDESDVYSFYPGVACYTEHHIECPTLLLTNDSKINS